MIGNVPLFCVRTSSTGIYVLCTFNFGKCSATICLSFVNSTSLWRTLVCKPRSSQVIRTGAAVGVQRGSLCFDFYPERDKNHVYSIAQRRIRRARRFFASVVGWGQLHLLLRATDAEWQWLLISDSIGSRQSNGLVRLIRRINLVYWTTAFLLCSAHTDYVRSCKCIVCAL